MLWGPISLRLLQNVVIFVRCYCKWVCNLLWEIETLVTEPSTNGNEPSSKLFFARQFAIIMCLSFVNEQAKNYYSCEQDACFN